MFTSGNDGVVVKLDVFVWVSVCTYMSISVCVCVCVCVCVSVCICVYQFVYVCGEGYMYMETDQYNSKQMDYTTREVVVCGVVWCSKVCVLLGNDVIDSKSNDISKNEKQR